MGYLPHPDTSNLNSPSYRPAWLLAGLALFGIGFGFVEAVVVVDLRAILEPRTGPSGPLSVEHALFPFLAFDRLEQLDPAAARLMRIEVLREAATLVMLAGAGLAAGRSFMQRFSALLIAFGVWDICYYLSLRLLLGWPATLWTWDVLFLIPVPWAAPVLAPGITATSMVVAGSAVLVWESTGCPFRVSRWDWAAIVAGGLILMVAFCWDFRNIAAGGLPNPFPWPGFFVGQFIGLCGFLHAAWTNQVARSRSESRVATRGSASLAMAEAERT